MSIRSSLLPHAGIESKMNSSILISDSPPPLEGIVYGKEWLSRKTCAELLEWPDKFPTLESNMMKVTTILPAALCLPEEIGALSSLPTLEIYLSMHATIELEAKDGTDCWFIFKSVGFDHSTFTQLKHVIDTVRFVTQLRIMDSWLTEEARKIDAEFEAVFRKFMEKSTCNSFIQPFDRTTIRIWDLLKFAGTMWLNDSCMDAILSGLRHRYGKCPDGKNILFIDQATLRGWIDLYTHPEIGEERGFTWTWEKEGLQNRTYSKAYAFIHMAGHWGAVAIDFRRLNMTFGDSFHKDFSEDTLALQAIAAIFKWLNNCMLNEDLKRWDAEVGDLRVNRQHDSSSCGIYAAQAIEYDILDRRHEVVQASEVLKWFFKDIQYHRVRYLHLTSNLEKVLLVECTIGYCYVLAYGSWLIS